MPQTVYDWIGLADYCALAAVALFGAYCCLLVWTRVGQKWFKTEEEQDAFLDSIEADLQAGNFEAVEEACEGDPRAVAMLVSLGVQNRHLGYAKVKQLLTERFRRDVLAELENNISWVTTVVKTAPMLGLFGTVTGMIGAFATLASAASVEPTKLAKDINVALYTTAIGLSIAIPLVMALNAVNNRIRHMEELVGSGVTRFLEAFRIGLARREKRSA
ncbi:MotA/TolQ/ExbB proton channel family protein [Aureliella helgolandensis]|uniref:Biopolymer transport protein ExbB n=1 Tax=Aureliella helgolandensis TaxID=2527968 RepID=A0A518GFJ2_9BACT|nr:MotA/TolQ/ExbB proton channel family protein [Aureliella helgolandensis]QDV27361.1 Biopolymer transport protein ExbB [Aureliella helgolandensis]